MIPYIVPIIISIIYTVILTNASINGGAKNLATALLAFVLLPLVALFFIIGIYLLDLLVMLFAFHIPFLFLPLIGGVVGCHIHKKRLLNEK
jgi:hypothetical protein